jgi:opacity protein-like surface antigen
MKIKEVALIAMILVSVNVFAQEQDKRFGFELSGGPSFSTTDPGNINLKTGAGFEGIFHYRFLQHTGVYAGWGWNRFATDNSNNGGSLDFEETGYVFGLQFKHPVGTSNVSYFLRAGGLYNHIEVENEEGDIIEDSGHGLGWQLAGGVDISLGKNWSLTPGVKYNALSREIEYSGNKSDMDFNYLSVRVGILKRF